MGAQLSAVLQRLAAAVAGSLLLVGRAPAQDELPAAVSERIAAIVRPACGDSYDAARSQCSTLAASMTSLPGATQAVGLETLAARCADVLPMTDEVVADIAEQALAARRQLGNRTPSPLVLDLLQVGLVRHHQGKVGETVSRYEEAVDIAGKKIGAQSEELAFALERLSYILSDSRRYDEAAVAADRSTAIRQAATPRNPGKVAESIVARGNVRFYSDDRVGAEREFRTALDFARQMPAGQDRDQLVARISHNLGEMTLLHGDAETARRLLEDTVALGRSDAVPPRWIPATLMKLGEAYLALGEYTLAIKTYEEAVAGHRCWVGSDPFKMAAAVTGLANALEAAHRWQDAMNAYGEAIAIRRSAVAGTAAGDERHRLRLYLARTLTRLGALQHQMGQSAAAATLAESLAIQEEELAGLPPHNDMAETLLAMARRELDDGDLAAARRHVSEAMPILLAVDAEQPLLIDADELAALAGEDSRVALAVAEDGLQRAVRAYGAGSPQAASAMTTKAELLRRLGSADAAASLAASAQLLNREQVVAVIQTFPGDLAVEFAGDRRRSLDLALAAVAGACDTVSPATIVHVWEATAASRALVFDAQAERQRLARASTDPETGAAARRLLEARRRLALLLVRSSRDAQPDAAASERARREASEAEENLASRTHYGEASAGLPQAAAAIAGRLPAHTALVSYARFASPPPAADGYLAFVLTAGSATPQAVALGSATEIDELVTRWRDLLATGEAADAESIRRAGDLLRQRIWDPLAPRIASATAVWLVPDGSLNEVSFPALSLADGRFLIEQGRRFHVLATERDVLRPPATRVAAGGALLVGGIDYEATDRFARSAAAPPRPKSAATTRAASCRATLPFFEGLPASAAEVDQVAQLWRRDTKSAGDPVVVLTGAAADEDDVKRQVVGKRILHFATHGFASLERCAAPASSDGNASPSPTVDDGALAGLALAGANRPVPADADEDGILLAEEVLDLDLHGVEWVVLSACETALGTVRAGEGVLGLRRSFQLAGARTVLSSLWAVDDQAAQRWMRELYSLRLRDGASTIEAVHRATLDTLAERRRRGLSTNPMYWAAFVAAGDWR